MPIPNLFNSRNPELNVFVNVPDRHEIQVADLAKGSVLAHWPVTCEDNFPMTLDEAHHRLFVECREPKSLVVFDTESGKTVASLEGPSSDDIFYDASKGRVYVLGQVTEGGDPRAAGRGFIDVFNRMMLITIARLGATLRGRALGPAFLCPSGENSLSPHVTKASRARRSLCSRQNEIGTHRLQREHLS